jgi:hypothetical protein
MDFNMEDFGIQDFGIGDFSTEITAGCPEVEQPNMIN